MYGDAMLRVSLPLLLVLLVGACAAPVPRFAPAPGSSEVAPCQRFFAHFDQAVEAGGVADTQAVRIPGFSSLRINRFLASFREELTTEPAFQAWVERLQALDRRGRQLEWANLTKSQRAQVLAALPGGYDDDVRAAIKGCGERLRIAELTAAEQHQRLRQVATVPDEYRTSWRVLGLYPLSSLVVRAAVARYQAQTKARFTSSASAPEPAGVGLRYGPGLDNTEPLERGQVAAILRTSAQNPLAIPEPSPRQRRQLLATFAPVWEIDTVTTADRFGAPVWAGGPNPEVDITRPVVYSHLSHTRLSGQNLLQLNYILWFPARPRKSHLDILGGHLDGITWRVTLAPDGHPLLFDTMHNCGCYHMYFPTSRLTKRPVTSLYQEPPLVPQPAPDLEVGQRPVIRVDHRTHYVVGFEADDGEPIDIRYPLKPYEALRSLPAADGQRSLFRPDGIVPGSQRAERWLLWPAGIPAPGAMRQWGHHAVAFVGRRHFDDPHLIERLFQLETSTNKARSPAGRHRQ